MIDTMLKPMKRPSRPPVLAARCLGGGGRRIVGVLGGWFVPKIHTQKFSESNQLLFVAAAKSVLLVENMHDSDIFSANIEIATLNHFI